jgi:LPXTG-site transpeptidase (sortase) family protein
MGGFIKFICGSTKSSSQEQYGIPNAWLEKYHLQLQQKNDLQQDLDNDGLVLADEYSYDTNPQEPDTDKDGYPDGEEVSNGYNPTGAGKMDRDKDGLPDAWEQGHDLSLTANDYALDPDGDSLPNYLELRHGTHPQKADTDGDGFGDSDEIRHGYDPSAPGTARPSYQITINKINVQAPLIWSTSMLEADLQADLKKGVVRYPQTGIPGQAGNMVATGHSSNYIWVEGRYNYIFKDLNNLQAGDEIVVTTTQANDKALIYKYMVTTKEVVNPDDQRIFEETPKQSLTIATCWPLNTNWKRLMLKAEQTN